MCDLLQLSRGQRVVQGQNTPDTLHLAKVSSIFTRQAVIALWCQLYQTTQTLKFDWHLFLVESIYQCLSNLPDPQNSPSDLPNDSSPFLLSIMH